MTARKVRALRRDEMAARLRGEIPAAVEWPDASWAGRILEFAHVVLGVEFLSEDQQKFLLAFQDGTYTTCRGGRKSGKTRAAGIAAWWYVCTYNDARVIMTAPTESSVDEILWRDVKALHGNARYALGGDLHLGPRTGWRNGMSAIYGRVARDAGGIRGLSGANVAYILDEASDIPDDIWATIDGNLAGGKGKGRASKALLVSNPTRLQGFFYDSHHRDARFARIHMPAIARDDIPGMATSEWIGAMADTYGIDSAYYAAHVLGNFPAVENSRVIAPHLLDAAEARWAATEAAGELVIGLDPATSESNDECAFAVRRGDRIMAVRCFRGQDEPAIAQLCCGLADEFRGKADEGVRVVLDAQGPIGERTLNELRKVASKARLTVIPLRYNDFRRQHPTLARQYDDLNGARWGAFVGWLREGGAVPHDVKLHDELLFPSWVEAESGKRRIVRKDEFRDALKRSPDRADAVVNSCWRTSVLISSDGVAPWLNQASGTTVPYNPYSHARDRSYNPYAR